MIGQTISHYKILEKLGEGGMGVVYKAQDTKLDRLVALKFLPASLTASENDRARFMQEARAAASLDHANICTIYGIEEHEGQLFFSMAFVEGTTLREKIPGMSLKQAIDIGIQISDGLAAAHEKGIVHRDIKPENIMIRKDGAVQIMDFGLAKLRAGSSKITRLTKQGSTVGTAGYMSPEQVQGQDADHRSDIFSFGVLLYELLTGRLPFQGVHETALAYEIVNVDPPPMSSIKPGIDPSLDAIVLECLEKDVNERAQGIKQVSVDLKRYKRESSRQRMSRITASRPAIPPPPVQSSSISSSDVVAPSEPIERSPASKIAPILAAVGTLLALLFLFLWSPWKSETSASDGVSRLSVQLQEGYELNLNWSSSPVDISPDGRMIAYSGINPDSGGMQLFLRPLDSFESRPIPGARTRDIMFSPDGQWIVYSSNGVLYKVSIDGGAPVRISGAVNPRGMCWGPDGSIYLVDGQAGGIVRIYPGGDSVATVTTPDASRGEISHRFPSLLPNEKALLLTVKYKTTATFDDAVIAVHNLETGKRKTLIEGGSYGLYVPTGHIVYVRNGSIFGVPFDPGSLELTGPTRELFSGGMLMQESGAASIAFSKSGTLVYAPGGPAPSQMLSVDWLSLKGQIEPLIRTPASYGGIALSPDRTKLALSVNAANNDIWTYDIRRSTMHRLTFGGGNHGNPVWSPDGKKLAFFAERDGEVGIYWRPWDGSGKEEKLIGEKGYDLLSAGFTPDGKDLLFYRWDKGRADVWVLPLDETRKPWPVLQTSFNEFDVKVSPTGRWLAYSSDESGKFDTYVIPFPKGGGKWQISSGGSNGHWWSRDGSEIYYIDFAGKMMSVPVKNGASLDPGTPRMLSDLNALKIPIVGNSFDPIAMRWAIIRALPGAKPPTSVNVVTGWFHELKH